MIYPSYVSYVIYVSCKKVSKILMDKNLNNLLLFMREKKSQRNICTGVHYFWNFLAVVSR